MHPQSPCPCGSPHSYAACCQPLHQGQPATSAEALMRSRYSAYTLGLVDYLIATTLPAQQSGLDSAAIAEWSRSSQWLGLEVAQAVEQGDQAEVQFVARWADASGVAQAHREHSAFVRKQQRWYFIDPGVALNHGRNEPCPCGSGRKFKQCCNPR